MANGIKKKTELSVFFYFIINGIVFTQNYNSYPFLVKKFKNFANVKVIEFAWRIAIFLNNAFPKIVKPAIIAAIKEGIKIDKKLPPLSIAIFVTMLAPAAPDKIPQTSPITSFKMLLTLSAFLTKAIACLLPLTFRAAIALKCSILLEATARPSISVKIASVINTQITIIAIINAEPLKTSSLAMLNNKERDMAKIKTINGHIQAFLFFCLFSLFFIIFI